MDDLKAKLMEIYEKAKERLPEASSWSDVFQFVVKDESGEQKFYIEFKGGELKIEEGEHPNPTATLTATREVMEKILSGELDAMRAFMTRQLQITGNVIKTMNLKKLIDAGLGKL